MDFQEENMVIMDRIQKSTPFCYDALEIDARYELCAGEVLLSYYEVSLAQFFGACNHQLQSGFQLYRAHSLNGNYFATFYRGNFLCHIYWIACEGELNVVQSNTGGAALPFKTVGKDRSVTPSVTQLRSDKANGMGYIVQLSDGSFILYDGGYTHHAEWLWEELVRLSGSEQGIVIRAWLITHAHGDHYPCFSEFAKRYAKKVRLETFMMSPVNRQDAADGYLNDRVFSDVAQFEGANILYVHTGMLFCYGTVYLEILFTADELYIAESREATGTEEQPDFNNSSIVSRVSANGSNCLFLGDAYNDEALRMVIYYGKELKSRMCQISHHGLENCSLLVYRHIQPQILFYPCSKTTYSRVGKTLARNENVRKALRKSAYTKEILTHDQANETRYLE